MDSIDIEKYLLEASLTETEKQVVDRVLCALASGDDVRIRTISDSCFTSMTTVTRAAKKLGYSSYKEMLYDLRSEMKRSHSLGLSSDEMRVTFSYSPDSLRAFYHLLDFKGVIGIDGDKYCFLVFIGFNTA